MKTAEDILAYILVFLVFNTIAIMALGFTMKNSSEIRKLQNPKHTITIQDCTMSENDLKCIEKFLRDNPQFSAHIQSCDFTRGGDQDGRR